MATNDPIETKLAANPATAALAAAGAVAAPATPPAPKPPKPDAAPKPPKPAPAADAPIALPAPATPTAPKAPKPTENGDMVLFAVPHKDAESAALHYRPALITNANSGGTANLCVFYDPNDDPARIRKGAQYSHGDRVMSAACDPTGKTPWTWRAK